MIHKAVQSIKYIAKALMLRKIAFLFLDLLSVYAALSFALYVRFDGMPPERHALRAQEYTEYTTPSLRWSKSTSW